MPQPMSPAVNEAPPPAPASDPSSLPYAVPAYTPPEPFIKKEYVVAGAAVGLLAWLILRKRK